MIEGRSAALVALAALVAGCTAKTAGVADVPAGKTYDFVTPALNSERTYTLTTVDDSGNTINQVEVETVTGVNTDGSYWIHQEDPNHQAFQVNGTVYAIPTEDISLNDAGQETGYTRTGTNGSLVSCTFDPHGAGPDYPLAVGGRWTNTYNFACGTDLPVSYSQTGTVEDVESITVAAGTFSALKLQSTLTWTDAGGTTHTQSITHWRDVDTMISVKEQTAITLSGNLPATGYPVSIVRILKSGP